jgi:hypothetical protein
MCDLNKISALIISAQIAALAALGCLITAIATSSNIFTSTGSVGLLIAACVLLGIAIGSLSAAATSTGPCMTGPCGGWGTALFVLLYSLIVDLGVMVTAIVIGKWGAAIPFFGAVVVIALVIALLVQIGLWPGLGLALIKLQSCLATGSALPGIAMALSVLLSLVALVALTKVLGMPGAPCIPIFGRGC